MKVEVKEAKNQNESTFTSQSDCQPEAIFSTLDNINDWDKANNTIMMKTPNN